MIRLVLAAALLAVTADHGWGQKRLRPIAYPVVQPEPPPPPIEVPPDTNPDPKSLEYGPADLEKARALTRQLGSREYKERESAARELGKIGRVAVIALREIRAVETSAEVRLRTDILLPRAESDDMRARVMCFLADKDGKFDHKLPGWTKFKEVAGSEKASRELFAEVLRRSEYHTLLMACEMTATELGQVLSTYYRVLQQKQNTGISVVQTPAELAVLAFLELQYPESELRINGQWGQASVGQYLYNQEIQNAMRNGTGKYGAPLQRIVGKWMDTRDSSFSAQMAMNLAQNWQLKDQLKYAARVLAARSDANSNWAKAQAAMQIAIKHNDKNSKEEAAKYLPLMVKGLDETALLTQVFIGGKNPNEVASVNTQDYVLGLLCRMTGQKPSEYGLDLQPNGGENFQNYANWFFKESEKEKAEDKRQAGIKKFKAWAEKNLQPGSGSSGKKEEPKKDEPAPPPTVAPPMPPLPKK